MVTLLDVPNGARKSRHSLDASSSASPIRRRPPELLDVPHRRMSDNDMYDAERHYYVATSPNRVKLLPVPTSPAQQHEPRSPCRAVEKRPKRLVAGSLSPRPTADRPTFSTQPSPSPNHNSCFTFPTKQRSNHRTKINVENYDDDDERPRSCDAVIPETTKSILAVDRYHDCSTENVRKFVSGMEHRCSGGPVVGGRAGCSTEVLLDLIDEDVAEAAGRKNVRFAPVVRVCDHTSTISYCHLRHQSASSAPAVLSGRSCSLPSLSSAGCVGSGSQAATSGRADKLDLPAVVDRYLIRCEREHQYVRDADDVHRFPPLRHRRT